MQPWDLIARVIFSIAGICAVWSIIHSVREAWPHIVELIIEELDQ